MCYYRGAVRALSRRPELPIAAVLGVLLLALAGRYGYHRDELYFLEAGRHPAWGYPDQPPLVPLVARLMSEIAPGSLIALRLPSALIAATVVVLAGAMARRLGAGPGGQALAAAATALSGIVLAMGHLLSTATFGLLGWTLLTFLLLRILQDGLDGPGSWLTAGVVAGLTLQANVLVAFLIVGVFVSVLVVGPRSLLRSPWPWAAALVAFLIALPYLIWQAGEGWPQLDVASAIASGGSGSSASRGSFVPLLVLQIGPWLAPLWLCGLVRLWREPIVRALALTCALLLIGFIALGGKPYYLAGLLPLLLAAGAQPVIDWAWRWVPVALLVLSLPAMVITLPVLPVSATDPVIAVNGDVGETIGWPALVRQIAEVHRELPAGAAIVTANYGQAGAIDRYGPALGLPSAYSGHNAYAEWGHPPGATPVLVVGIGPGLLSSHCTNHRGLGRLESPHDLDNDENGTPLTYCVPTRSWRDLWPSFTHLD
jgi:4-amino-4-deoxy-L-arabinose transferase-like glycosyltransferase